MTFEIWSKNCTLHSVREIQTDKTITLVGKREKERRSGFASG